MQTECIKKNAAALKCAWIRDNIDDFLIEAYTEDWSIDKAISTLFEGEITARRHNSVRRKFAGAHFPYAMDFSSFDTHHLAAEIVREVRHLETLEFIKANSNVILLGNPGVGKTALAVAVGTKACNDNMSVSFINVSDLVIRIKEAMSLNEITRLKRSFERFDLVIIDDLGYCSFNKECGEILFNLISSRAQRGSMIITTNLTFDKWNDVFNDPVLTGAIVDRVAHKAHMVDMTGESYRVLETKRWIKDATEATQKQ